MPRGDSYQLQGQGGLTVLGAGQSSSDFGYSGAYRWMTVVSDATLAAFNVISGDNTINLETPTVLPAGLGIGGEIVSVIVDAGLVILYKE